ncbi:hypothetical protein ACROYT_G030347 [Oculina patagonica]
MRLIFKQEWNNLHKETKGEWKDEPRNGLDFWHGESPQNKSKNAYLLTTMINGNTAEWDCTMLFYAILESDCIHGLSPVVQSNVDDLKKFRNEEFKNMPQGHLTDAEFRNAISKVDVAVTINSDWMQVPHALLQVSEQTEVQLKVSQQAEVQLQVSQQAEVQLQVSQQAEVSAEGFTTDDRWGICLWQ